MKKGNKRGNMFTLLLSNYILFTLLLALILVILVSVYLFRTVGIMVGVDPSQIKNYDKDLSEERFEQFPTERLLGTRGFIIVLNEQRTVVYQSGMLNGLQRLTENDLLCIQDYTAAPVISVRPLSSGQGERRRSVSIQETFSDKQKYHEYILDESNRLVFQSGNLPMASLTDLQASLLTDTLSSDYSLQKYSFRTQAGEARTLLLAADRSAASAAVGKSWNSFFLLFGIAYGVMVLLFILWLNRRIKKPLSTLCRELNHFESGDKSSVYYRGPREFVEIFDSFNAMAERLHRSEEERRTLEAAKQKLLADISHDLKTPITVVRGYAKALHDGVIPQEDQQNILAIMDQKAEGLNELIDTFYEYSKMEHPDYTLTLTPCDICNYLRDYVAERYSGLELGGNLIEADIPEMHIRCNIDKVHLGRALDNLVNNAVKHNPKGTTLYFSLEPQEGQVRILVADNGVGIPQELRETIFEPFVVGEKSRCKNGSGLGLSIARKIITAHHGTICLLPPQEPYSTAYEIFLPTL